MFRKAILGVVAVMSLMVVSSGTASAYYRGGYHGYRYGYRGPIGPVYRRGFVAPPVYVAPPVAYGYPGVGGYGYGGGYAPGYGYGYGAPGVGVSAPGFGFYVR